MTPAQARAFHAVAQTGSFTAAARLLGLSQPTVTSQVKSIERRYNVELFHRSSRGVRLTPAGDTLQAIVRRMFGAYDEAVSYLDETRGLRRGHLKVGSYGPYDVMAMLAEMQRRFPGIETTVAFANSHDLPALLRDYQIDVAVLARTEPSIELTVHPFVTRQLIAIAPRAPPWETRSRLRTAELTASPLVLREAGSAVRLAIEKLLLEAGVPRAEFVEVGSREGVVAAVAAGLGLSAIFDEGLLPDDKIVKLAISDSTVRLEIDVVCLKERETSAMVREFMGIARSLSEQSKRMRPAQQSGKRPRS